MNGQIFISAAIATAIVLVPIVIVQLLLKFDWKKYWFFVCIMLPGSAVINLGFKNWLFLGLNALIPSTLDEPTLLLIQFLVFYPIWVLVVGISEELTKLAPALIPLFRKDMKTSELSTVQSGWSLGCGFGIGEIWYLAFLIALEPLYAPYKWFEYGGFIFERSLVVFLHAAMTILAVYGFHKMRLWLTILLAILAHAFIDYLAVLSLLYPAVYYLFIVLMMIAILLVVLAFIAAKTNDEEREWQKSIPESSPLEQGEIIADQEPQEIKSLFSED